MNMNTASAAASVASAASKASNFANQTVETARFEAIKEPLGFIKILQFFLAIFAFAVAVNGSSSLAFSSQCVSSNASTGVQKYIYQADFGYPYDIGNTGFKLVQDCPSGYSKQTLSPTSITTKAANIVSSAQFFVFVGVMAFLYSLAFLIIYVFFKHKYDNNIYFPLIDFVATCVFALVWFISSIAWAKAISDIQNYTSPDTVTSVQTACTTKQNSCSSITYPNYANIVISCIFGFGNLILWAGNIWFVLKETSWYKTRKQLEQAQQNVTNNPISPSGVTISAQYNSNNKI